MALFGAGLKKILDCNCVNADLRLRLEFELEIDDVEPPGEFEADSLEVAYFHESEIFVDFDTTGLLGGNADDDRAVSEGLGAVDEFAQQQAADAALAPFGMEINGIFHGEAEGAAPVIGGKGGPAYDLSAASATMTGCCGPWSLNHFPRSSIRSGIS